MDESGGDISFPVNIFLHIIFILFFNLKHLTE